MKKIGISCKSEDWIEMIRKIDSSIFQHVELNIYNADSDARMFDKNYLNQVKKLLEGKKLSVSVHTIEGTNLAEKVNRIRQASVDILVDTIKMAEYINAKWVVTHIGNGGFSGSNREKKRDRNNIAVQSIKEILCRCRNMKTKLALENLYNLPSEQKKCKLGSTIEEFEYIFSQINTNKVGLLYDVGHNNIGIDKRISNRHFLTMFPEQLIAIHIHYNDGIEDLHYGLNRFPFAKYEDELKLIKSFEREIYLVCESYTWDENIGSQMILKEYLN